MPLHPVYGPYTVEIKVHIINDESGQRGEATITMGNGSMPTEKEVAARLEKFSNEQLPKLAPDFRLQTAPELWDTLCMEEVGETFAVPAQFREYANPTKSTAE